MYVYKYTSPMDSMAYWSIVSFFHLQQVSVCVFLTWAPHMHIFPPIPVNHWRPWNHLEQFLANDCRAWWCFLSWNLWRYQAYNCQFLEPINPCCWWFLEIRRSSVAVDKIPFCIRTLYIPGGEGFLPSIEWCWPTKINKRILGISAFSHLLTPVVAS